MMADKFDLLAPNVVAIVLFIFCVAIFCAIMGKQKEFNPWDYESIDIEAIAQDVTLRSDYFDISVRNND
jgi:hypothetical protein